jgi:hypothetical protein
LGEETEEREAGRQRDRKVVRKGRSQGKRGKKQMKQTIKRID